MSDRLVLVASANARIGMDAGVAVLRDGGTALDAVEAVVRVVEDNPDDHTVGYGGFPNILGDVELDASIMDGHDRRAGAVAGITGFRHPISVARAVMEHLPHVLLVGSGAAVFAQERGCEARDMLTEAAADVWRRGLAPYTHGLSPQPPFADMVRELVLDPEHVTGTVNVIARDSNGRLASAASTSGWAWKYPGRAGDTGSIGAGNYCDDRYGAATCTGWGELAIRAGVARAIVAAFRWGCTIDEACREVLNDLPDAGMGTDDTPLHVLAVARDGTYGAFSTSAQSQVTAWTSDQSSPTVSDRIQILADKERTT
jgi:beta-aspartyl-peptidase (threonine type)